MNQSTPRPHRRKTGLLLFLGMAIALGACKDASRAPPPGVQVSRNGQALRPPLDSIADTVLGQSDSAHNGVNLIDGRGVNYSEGVALDKSVSPPRLYLADTENHRVLAWANAQSFAAGAQADKVIGQASFLENACNTGTTPRANTVCRPRAVAVDALGNLYVADFENHRVLEFNKPFGAGAGEDSTADRVFGQGNSFTTNTCNRGGLVGSDTLCGPSGVALDSAGNLYVSERWNHRILKFTSPLTTDDKADVVLGQANMGGHGPNGVDGQGLSLPTRVAVDRSVTPNRLYVADRDNSRVLGWPNAAAFANGAPATLVIGQANFTSGDCNRGFGVSDQTLCGPRGMAVDPTNGTLFVADWGNHRVLAYLSPFTTDTTADKVWGQPSMTTNGWNQGGLSASSLHQPHGVALGPTGDLYAADTLNHRVLKYAGGYGGGTTASAVWGQNGNFTTADCNATGVSNRSLCYPFDVGVDASGNLFVADHDNHRILVFNPSPADDSADRVFGQGNSFTSNACNLGGLTASSLCVPTALAFTVTGTLWVGDSENRRALGYTSPLSTDLIADAVFGMPNFTSNQCSPVSASCLYWGDIGVASDSAGNLYVANSAIHRVLGVDAPVTSGKSAGRVLGQGDFSSNGRNFINATGVNEPAQISVDVVSVPNRLYVADQLNTRVLGWSNAGTLTNGQAADRVFGQPNYTTSICNYGGVSGSSLCEPTGVGTDSAGNLYVADHLNNRVLEYNAPYGAGDTTADRVFGQSSMGGNQGNTGGISALTLNRPKAVVPDAAGGLVVLDSENYRALRYDAPLTSDTSADDVLGQTGLRYNGANLVDSVGMNFPAAIALDTSVIPNRLYVADRSNSRILAWGDVTSFTTGSPADRVLGQPDMFTSACNSQGAVSATSLCFPWAVAVDTAGRVYVADSDNDRILIYDSPFTSDTAADKVVGQPTLAANGCNRGLPPSASGLCGPRGVALDALNNLYVGDFFNHRVLEYDTPWASGNMVADRVFGQLGAFTTNACNTSGVTASSLCLPWNVAVDRSIAGGRLYVADHQNNRVLEYDGPLSSDTVADLVLGQTNMNSFGCAVSDTGLCRPVGVAVDGAGTVYVGDRDLHRVLEFTSPRTTDTVAERAFGQANVYAAGCNRNLGVASNTLCEPHGLATDSIGSLYVGDARNHRVVVYLANTRPVVSSLTLNPPNPKTDDPLVAAYNYGDADGDPKSALTQIKWFKGALEQGAYAGWLTLPAMATSRGDQWSFTVRPHDGLEFGPVASSPSVTIGNTSPTAASPAVSPATPLTNDLLTATFTYGDADGDTEGTHEIRWYNGPAVVSLYNNARSVPASATSRGEAWSFTLRPHDGTDYGSLATSPAVVIGNTAPAASNVQINPVSPKSTDSLMAAYTYFDADGDSQAGTQIRWWRNFAPQSTYDDAPTVSGPLTAGDQWYFVVTPKDGTTLGAPVTSTAVVIGGSAPTATALVITPDPPQVVNALVANYAYSDPDGQAETASQIRWYQNNVPQSALDNQKTLPVGHATRYQLWYFTVRPCDSTATCGLLQTSPSVTVANTAPTTSSAAISPSTPKTDDALAASYTYFDPDADSQAGSEIRWYKNGFEQGSFLNQLSVPASATSRGDSWYYVVRPRDGTDYGSAVTAPTVAVGNTAPMAASLSLTPVHPKKTDQLLAAYFYSDADGDLQSGSTVRWFKGAVEQTALANQLVVPPSLLTKGDAWYFIVRPRDGFDLGSPATSPTVTVENSAPIASNVAVSPATPRAGEALVRSYLFGDADGDSDSATQTRWYVNSVEVPSLFNLSSVLGTTPSKGQRWKVGVTPGDGTDLGATVFSSEVVIANSSPSASNVTLTPNAPRTTDDLTIAYVFIDPDVSDSEAGTEIQWHLNNEAQVAYSGLRTLPASATTRGDVWYATVKPRDGIDFGALVTSTAVTIVNSLPVAGSLLIAPPFPKVTDTIIGAYTYADADGDTQLGSEVRWFRNGVEVTALAGMLSFDPVAAGAQAGDTIYFTVRPKDGIALGASVQSPSVLIGVSAPFANAVTLSPPFPRTDVPLIASYAYFHPNGLPELVSATQITWFRNGASVPALTGQKTVPAWATTKADTWKFTVAPSDGTVLGAEQHSNEVVIQNSPPRAQSVRITPSQANTTDELQAVYTFSDADGDAEQGSEIRWFRNGLEQSALLNSAIVPAALTSKREMWVYKIVPKDGEDVGLTEISDPVFIANTPPIASAGPDQTIGCTGSLMRVTLDGTASSDVDGDVLAYTWTEGGTPLGTGSSLSIDLPLGDHPVLLTVSDGESSTTDQVLINLPCPLPTSTATSPLEVPPGRVFLVGSASDQANRPLSYQWTQLSGEPVVLMDADRPTAWFFAIHAGDRDFQLVATAGADMSAPAQVKTTIRNVGPTAEALSRVVLATGAESPVDGSHSDDPNGDPLLFRWSLEDSGAPVTLTKTGERVLHVAPDREGRFFVQLSVGDGQLEGLPASVEIFAVDPSLTAHRPVALAGPDDVAEVGQFVALDGRSSFDVDGDPLTYTWAQLSGPQGDLADADKALASFKASAPGKVELVLTVGDIDGTSEGDSLWIEVTDPTVNHRPVARAGSDQITTVGSVVELDGSRSADLDGTPMTYLWRQLSGVTITLDDPASPRPRFVALRPGAVRLSLVVADGSLASSSSIVSVRVTSAGNRVPLASAGADQQVLIDTDVSLDATGSSDPDGDALHYVWEQLWGPPVVLAGVPSSRTFHPRGTGHFRFRLTVWDAEAPSLPDEVDVLVKTHGLDNQAPVANPGADTEVKVGTLVTLDGSGSHDPDPLDRLTFQWSVAAFPTGSEPVLQERTTASPSFTPETEGSYTVQLRVSDGDLSSAPAYVTIVARSPKRNPIPCGCGLEGRTALPWAGLLVLLSGALRRRPRRRA